MTRIMVAAYTVKGAAQLNNGAALRKVQLYGDYRRPYGSFRWFEQPDLRKAYESGRDVVSISGCRWRSEPRESS
jgi:hypothetical protein